MNERYTQLYRLKENQYAEGSPVKIKAGVLLRDNQTGNVFARMIFKNISQRTISELKVRISALDASDGKLGEDIEYHYQGVFASPGGEFGSKSVIPLPDTLTRSFSIAVTEAVFSKKGFSFGNARSVPVGIPQKPQIDPAAEAEKARRKAEAEAAERARRKAEAEAAEWERLKAAAAAEKARREAEAEQARIDAEVRAAQERRRAEQEQIERRERAEKALRDAKNRAEADAAAEAEWLEEEEERREQNKKRIITVCSIIGIIVVVMIVNSIMQRLWN